MPDAPGAVDAPEQGDVPDTAEAPDTDNVQHQHENTGAYAGATVGQELHHRG